VQPWVFVVIFLVQQAATIIHLYVYFLPVVGADSDAFHYGAYFLLNKGSTPLENTPYVQMLGFFYSLFGISKGIGCQLTHLAFGFCAVLFVEMTSLLGFSRQRIQAGLLIFGLLPSCALHAAVTMRETYQAAGFLLFVYGALRLRIKGMDIGFFSIGLGALWLIFFHKGFALFLLLALPLSLTWATGTRINRMLATGAVVFVVLFLFGDNLWQLMLEKSYSLQVIVEGQGIEYIDNYADQVERGRSDFDVNLKLNSFYGFISTAPVVFIYYLFSPLPWQIGSSLDIEGFAESLLRMYLLLKSLVFIRKSSGEERKIRTFLVVIFLLMESTWAAGTSNWGTAVRHRLVAWPLLVVMGLWQSEGQAEVKIKTLTKRQKMREIRKRHREKLSVNPD